MPVQADEFAHGTSLKPFADKKQLRFSLFRFYQLFLFVSILFNLNRMAIGAC